MFDAPAMSNKNLFSPLYVAQEYSRIDSDTAVPLRPLGSLPLAPRRMPVALDTVTDRRSCERAQIIQQVECAAKLVRVTAFTNLLSVFEYYAQRNTFPEK